MNILTNKIAAIIFLVFLTITSCKKEVSPLMKGRYILRHSITVDSFGNILTVDPVSPSNVFSFSIEEYTMNYLPFQYLEGYRADKIEIFLGSRLIYKGNVRSFSYNSPPTNTIFTLDDDFGTIHFTYNTEVLNQWPEMRQVSIQLNGENQIEVFHGLYEYTYP